MLRLRVPHSKNLLRIRVTQVCRHFTTRSSEELQEFGERHVTGGLGRTTKGIMIKGEGSHVYFQDGKKMLDFTCGIGVTNLGHCHPKVSNAAAEQCLNLNHAQCSIAFHEPYIRLIEKLLPAMPDKSLDSFFFWNSGSEAVEAALKMARIITGKQNIICMQGAYHGRTFGALGVTKSKTIYGEGVAPLMPGTFPMPYPYWHQHGLSPSTSSSVLTAKSLYQLHLLLAQQTAPSETAAIILEPVLGEGGYVPAPKEFLEGLREVCDKHNMLLIIDEVQCGFGRTGSWFYIEESGVRPDILLMAKGMANGFPLSGVVSRRELTSKLKPGSMGGTYAGNAVSCAAACAVADVMREENVLANVQARSKQLFSTLRSLQNDSTLSPYILDVRGRGLMVAMEFASSESVGAAYDEVKPQKPVKNGLANRVAKKCNEKGMLLLTTSAYEVVRFIPALNITQQEMEQGCGIFEEALREAVAEEK
ncbi:acetylornithine aminotransferase [Marasmius fiardii PR-910]|nr:acetylornithine aminotransferase [Marasmius fiardii PR-910]